VARAAGFVACPEVVQPVARRPGRIFGGRASYLIEGPHTNALLGSVPGQPVSAT
jgi:hypothetical protein